MKATLKSTTSFINAIETRLHILTVIFNVIVEGWTSEMFVGWGDYTKEIWYIFYTTTASVGNKVFI